MLCKDLKVVNLNITEDNYEYKALLRLCTKTDCMDVDMEDLAEDKFLMKIKEKFSIDEPIEHIREMIMEKIMEASKLESRISEGEKST